MPSNASTFTQADVSLLADIADGFVTLLHYDRLDDLRKRLRAEVEKPAAPLPTAPEPTRYACTGCDFTTTNPEEAAEHYITGAHHGVYRTAAGVVTLGLDALLTEMDSALGWLMQVKASRVGGAPTQQAAARYRAARTAIEAHVGGLESRISGLQAIIRHYGKLTEANEASELALRSALTKIAGLASDDDDGDPEWTLGEIVKLAALGSHKARHVR